MKDKIPMVFLVVALVLLLVLLSFVTFYTSPKKTTVNNQAIPEKKVQAPAYTQATFKIGTQTMTADLADDPAKRTLGLSGRTSLGYTEGMLFVFEESGLYAFWMKDMLFPIDIIWIADNGTIVHIEKSLSPNTYPQSFAPNKPAKYVLETQSGFSSKENLKVGDIIVLPTGLKSHQF